LVPLVYVCPRQRLCQAACPPSPGLRSSHCIGCSAPMSLSACTYRGIRNCHKFSYLVVFKPMPRLALYFQNVGTFGSTHPAYTAHRAWWTATSGYVHPSRPIVDGVRSNPSACSPGGDCPHVRAFDCRWRHGWRSPDRALTLARSWRSIGGYRSFVDLADSSLRHFRPLSTE
jgi:hypothetical protein